MNTESIDNAYIKCKETLQLAQKRLWIEPGLLSGFTAIASDIEDKLALLHQAITMRMQINDAQILFTRTLKKELLRQVKWLCEQTPLTHKNQFPTFNHQKLNAFLDYCTWVVEQTRIPLHAESGPFKYTLLGRIHSLHLKRNTNWKTQPKRREQYRDLHFLKGEIEEALVISNTDLLMVIATAVTLPRFQTKGIGKLPVEIIMKLRPMLGTKHNQ